MTGRSGTSEARALADSNLVGTAAYLARAGPDLETYPPHRDLPSVPPCDLCSS